MEAKLTIRERVFSIVALSGLLVLVGIVVFPNLEQLVSLSSQKTYTNTQFIAEQLFESRTWMKTMQRQLQTIGSNVEKFSTAQVAMISDRGVYGILLQQELVLAEMRWTNSQANPTEDQCREANLVLSNLVRSFLPKEWTFKPPQLRYPGSLTFEHSPSALTWYATINLEGDSFTGRSLLWVVRIVRSADYRLTNYNEINFFWAWNDLRGVFADALAKSTNKLSQLGWEVAVQ